MSLPPSLPVWARLSSDGICLHIHVVPGAKRSHFAGLYGDRLKIRVAAAPEAGAANEAVLSMVETWIGQGSCQIISGAHHRQKILLLRGIVKLPALPS